MRFLPLVILLIFVPLAFVRSFESPVAELPVGEAPTPATQVTDDLADILPRDAAVVIHTADWDAIRDRASTSAWVAFFSDERFTNIVQGWFGASAPTLGPGFPTIGELLGSVHGSAAFFLVPAGRGTFDGGVVLQAGGSHQVLADTLKQIQEMVKGQSSVTRETYAGVELVRFETPGQDEVVVACASEQLVGIFIGQSAVSADAMARATIDRRLGISPKGGFSGGRLGRSAPEHEREPAFSLHLDVQRLADAASPGWRHRPEAEVLQQTGLADVRWVHAHADIGEAEEFEMAFSMHLPEDGLLAALASGFGPLPGDMAEMLPARSLGVGLVNYDVGGAIDAVQAFLAENHPEASQGLQMALQMGSTQLGADLEEDFFGQLTGRFASFSVRVPESEVSTFLSQGQHTNALAQGGAFFVEMHDSEPVERILDQVFLISELDTQIEQRVFEGTEVNSIDFEDVFALHWAFTEEGLFVSEYESALYAALRQVKGELEGSAAEDTRFRKALEEVSGASAASLVETQSSVEALLGMGHALLGLAASTGAVPPGLIQLPDPAMAGEYFQGTLLLTMENEADRLTFRFRAK